MKKINLLILLSFISLYTFAADGAKDVVAAPPSDPGLGLSSTEMLILLLLLFVVVLLVVSVTLLSAFKVMYREQLNPTPYIAPEEAAKIEYEKWAAQQNRKAPLWNKLLGLKPIEQEKDLVIEHAYDGIQELDNPVPAWFNILFFGTMLFAAGYLFYYHIGGYGDLQDTEYAKEMVKADEQKALYLEKSANAIDEHSVKLDQAANILEEGKNIFKGNCVVCHGDAGQGGIGPNLTDAYWLHGGGIQHVFKTIKYGVPEKGMVSWEKNLNPKQISAVANYIISLEGSNPAGAKAPQGEKYEATAVPADSVKTANDTTK